MGKFLTTGGRVAVYENDDLPPDHPDQHTVFIKDRFNMRDMATVRDKMMHLKVGDGSTNAEATIFGMQLEMLCLGIVAWSGPEFGNIQPSRQIIEESINPHDPLWQKVIAKLDELNKEPDTRLPKLTQTPSTNGGHAPFEVIEGGTSGVQSASATTRSTSRNGTSGRRT